MNKKPYAIGLLALLLCLALCLAACAAEQPPAEGTASAGQTPAEGQDAEEPAAAAPKVILVVSFGTSYNDSRDNTIGAIETAIQDAYPDYQVRRAFTSQIIIDKLAERDGLVIDNVAQAVERLIADGVKELNLISQDTTYYGLDLRSRRDGSIAAPDRFHAAAKENATTLCSLLRELNDLPGEFWIRLLYTHPAHWTDELIETIAECPKVARYIDMPLQHIHANMLERMRRETSEQYIRDLIQKIRAGIPDVALRTTFIVGFPGETDGCFQRLIEFIRETRFERLGVFAYSREDGTRAAKMESQISDKLKQERRNEAMAAQHEVAVRVAESFVGRKLNVLVEGAATAGALKKANVHSWEHGLVRGSDSDQAQLRGRYLVARSHADAPDVDGRV